MSRLKMSKIWRPQPRQREFLQALGLLKPDDDEAIADIVGYGGAAGGGKTDALLAAGLAVALRHQGAQVGFFRRQLSELSGAGGAIARSHELLAPLGKLARWDAQKYRWQIGKSVLQFCYCDSEQDVYRYQGWQFDALLIDEATHLSEFQVSYLTSRARLNADTLKKPVIAMASNPGNIGHAWFERIFQPMLPQAVRHARWEGATHQFTTYFIPARLQDNAILCERDPSYRERLESLDEVLRLQLLEGRWDVYEGVAFPHMPAIVREEIDCPRWVVGIDWGYASPFAAVLVGQTDDNRLFVARECYEAGLTPAEQAQRVREMIRGQRILRYIADASTFAMADGVNSIADQWRKAGLAVVESTRERVNSLNLLRQLFREGMVLVHARCENLLRELRNAQIDTRTRREDIVGEDHAIDALRYAVAELQTLPPLRPVPDEWSAEQIRKRAIRARREGVRLL